MSHDRSKAAIRARIAARALAQSEAVRPWAGAFVALIGQGVGISEAARRLGVARSTIYAARVSDPNFAERWDAAACAVRPVLSPEERIEALFLGEAVPIFYNGRQVGVRRVFPKTSAIIRRLQNVVHQQALAPIGPTLGEGSSAQFHADDPSTLSNG